MFVGEGSEIMIKERNFGKCDSVSSASSRRALEHIVPGGHREVQQWDRVRVKADTVCMTLQAQTGPEIWS